MFRERFKLEGIVNKIEDQDMPFTMDGSLSAIKNSDGSITYFATDLGGLPYYRIYRGTEMTPFEQFEGEFFWDYNGYPQGYPNGLWILSAYQCKDGMLIGFVHRESFSKKGDKNSISTFHIGLGVSEDGGKNWFYVGDICDNCCNGQLKERANMGGCPVLEKEGYFYIYFNEYKDDFVKYVSAARFSVKETINALKEKKLPHVYKYSGNEKWNIKGIGGTGEPIIKVSPYSNDPYNLEIDAHSKATYCRSLECYIMTMQTGKRGDLILYFSKDAEHWEEYMIIDKAEKETNGYSEFMLPYSCFVDSSGKGRQDNFEVGNEFYIHTVHKKIKEYSYDEYFVNKVVIKQ